MVIHSDSIGYRLRALRLSQGKSQEAFAGEMGISNSVLSRYEKNLRRPDTYFFHLLRIRTGVDLNWLFCGEGKMFPPAPLDLGRKLELAREIVTQASKIHRLLQELRKF